MARARRGVVVRDTPNKDRDFGEVRKWAGSVILTIDGKDRTFHFTESDLIMHLRRSESNPEDALKRCIF